MAYHSNVAPVKAMLGRAARAGLVAAVQPPRTRVMRELKKGFTTGKWRHAMEGILGRVAVTPPFLRNGKLTILLGLRKFAGYEYGLAWELGFRQRLVVWFDEKRQQWVSPKTLRRRKKGGGIEEVPNPTRFVRKEIWRPALLETAAQQQRAFVRAYQAVAKGGAVPTLGRSTSFTPPPGGMSEAAD